MKFPAKLNLGDTIGLVAPSSPVSSDRIDQCVFLLQNMGYKIKEGANCRKAYHGYLAGTDAERAQDINDMFADDTVKAIFCLRGGNGSGRIMNLLDYDMIRRNPKIFVGYSDITNLLMAFNTRCGFVTYHGPMVSSNMLNNYDLYTKECFEAVLNMEEQYTFHNPDEREIKVLVPGKAKGQLIGGNLSLLINMLGTYWAPNYRGKILFIEDIYESVPNVDRMICQMKALGIFDQIAGLIIGDFSDCKNEYDESFLINEYIQDQFADLKVPVMYNIGVGHCYPTGSLIMGCECEIDTAEREIKLLGACER